MGRTELSVELTGEVVGAGTGRVLVEAALANLAADATVFAQVAPGNAASIRLLLALDFVPIGSEVLIAQGESEPSKYLLAASPIEVFEVSRRQGAE